MSSEEKKKEANNDPDEGVEVEVEAQAEEEKEEEGTADVGDVEQQVAVAAATETKGNEDKDNSTKKKTVTVLEEETKTKKKKEDEDVDDEEDPVITRPSNNNNNKKKIPSTFYCPLTKKIFQDPVVASNGITYEKSAITTTTTTTATSADDDDDEHNPPPPPPYYENRALQEVIQEHLSNMDDSMRSKLLRIQKSMKSQLGKLLDQTPLTSSSSSSSNSSASQRRIINNLPLPESYYCPITFSLLHDPVIDPDGNTFERRAIQTWIRVNHNSPLTRVPLEEIQLYDNLAIKDIIQDEANKSDISIHPSIRKWKEEPKPEPLPPVGTQGGGGGIEYPSTPEQLQEARRQQEREYVRAQVSSVACIALTIFVIYVVPYGTAIAIVYFLLVCCYSATQQQEGQQQFGT